MTQYDILRMAREAGFTWEPISNISGPLERFAALVAAAERRKHLADIEQWRDAALTAEKWRGMALGKDPMGAGRTVQKIQREAVAAERKASAEHYLAVMRKAIKEEREQCATLCEKQKSNWNYCAAAIRARSNT